MDSVKLVIPEHHAALLYHALQDYRAVVQERVDSTPEGHFSPNDQLGQLAWLARYIGHKAQEAGVL